VHQHSSRNTLARSNTYSSAGTGRYPRVCTLFLTCSCACGCALQADSPAHRFYWGYIWDGTGNRCTTPIRNRNNKSHIPVEQVCEVDCLLSNLYMCTQIGPAHLQEPPALRARSPAGARVDADADLLLCARPTSPLCVPSCSMPWTTTLPLHPVVVSSCPETWFRHC
jgi:hypothetical protein